jgi:hypothetical protein
MIPLEEEKELLRESFESNDSPRRGKRALAGIIQKE